jgi:hypothetical protein
LPMTTTERCKPAFRWPSRLRVWWGRCRAAASIRLSRAGCLSAQAGISVWRVVPCRLNRILFEDGYPPCLCVSPSCPVSQTCYLAWRVVVSLRFGLSF